MIFYPPLCGWKDERRTEDIYREQGQTKDYRRFKYARERIEKAIDKTKKGNKED